jgi:hypothetical protein
MRKLKLTIITVIFYFISQQAMASIITADLPENTYISYAGYDWTWASPVSSTEYVFDDGDSTNILQDPNFHMGWMFIVGENLTTLFDNLSLSDFTDINGDYIQSAAYWNSHIIHVDPADYDDGRYYNLATEPTEDHYANYETFYVRVAVTNIPEPLTIVIFTLGLFTLTIRAFKLRNEDN